jgi:hypothetical protein
MDQELMALLPVEVHQHRHFQLVQVYPVLELEASAVVTVVLQIALAHYLLSQLSFFLHQPSYSLMQMPYLSPTT